MNDLSINNGLKIEKIKKKFQKLNDKMIINKIVFFRLLCDKEPIRVTYFYLLYLKNITLNFVKQKCWIAGIPIHKIIPSCKKQGFDSYLFHVYK